MEPKFKYKDSQFVKVYRKMLNWQWYDDVNTKVLFLHCLLRANWTSGEWHGIHFDKGEFITSIPSLAAETGLSTHQVRTALNHLISTGEVTSRTTDKVTGKKLTKNRIITVKKWSQYQPDDRQNGNQTSAKVAGKRQASVRQASADREIKEKTTSENIKRKKEIGPAALSSNEELAVNESAEEKCEEVDFGAMTDEEFERWMREHK